MGHEDRFGGQYQPTVFERFSLALEEAPIDFCLKYNDPQAEKLIGMLPMAEEGQLVLFMLGEGGPNDTVDEPIGSIRGWCELLYVETDLRGQEIWAVVADTDGVFDAGDELRFSKAPGDTSYTLQAIYTKELLQAIKNEHLE